MSLEKLWYQAIVTPFGLAGAGFALIAAAIVVGQTVTWLKRAIWEPYTSIQRCNERVPSMFRPVSMASPIGVSPATASVGGVKLWAPTKSVSTFTGPKVTIPTSTLLMQARPPRVRRGRP
jgi:hypothetical protein